MAQAVPGNATQLEHLDKCCETVRILNPSQSSPRAMFVVEVSDEEFKVHWSACKALFPACLWKPLHKRLVYSSQSDRGRGLVGNAAVNAKCAARSKSLLALCMNRCRCTWRLAYPFVKPIAQHIKRRYKNVSSGFVLTIDS